MMPTAPCVRVSPYDQRGIVAARLGQRHLARGIRHFVDDEQFRRVQPGCDGDDVHGGVLRRRAQAADERAAAHRQLAGSAQPGHYLAYQVRVVVDRLTLYGDYGVAGPQPGLCRRRVGGDAAYRDRPDDRVPPDYEQRRQYDHGHQQVHERTGAQHNRPRERAFAGEAVRRARVLLAKHSHESAEGNGVHGVDGAAVLVRRVVFFVVTGGVATAEPPANRLGDHQPQAASAHGPDANQAGRESEAELDDAYAEPLRGNEVAQLVDENQKRQNGDDEQPGW